jgi:tetratricopeptide (TPR) repeat protein
MGRNEEAAAEYQRVLEIDPDNSYIQYRLGNIYFISQHIDKAIPLWRKSVPQLPPDGDKYFDLAFALMATGQFKEAEQYARTAVALDAKSSRNRELLETILGVLADRGASSNQTKPAH